MTHGRGNRNRRPVLEFPNEGSRPREESPLSRGQRSRSIPLRSLQPRFEVQQDGGRNRVQTKLRSPAVRGLSARDATKEAIQARDFGDTDGRVIAEGEFGVGSKSSTIHGEEVLSNRLQRTRRDLVGDGSKRRKESTDGKSVPLVADRF